jgi:hypothetical protein
MYTSIDYITYSTYIPSLIIKLQYILFFIDNDLIFGVMILDLRSDLPENPASRLTGLLDASRWHPIQTRIGIPETRIGLPDVIRCSTDMCDDDTAYRSDRIFYKLGTRDLMTCTQRTCLYRVVRTRLQPTYI